LIKITKGEQIPLDGVVGSFQLPAAKINKQFQQKHKKTKGEKKALIRAQNGKQKKSKR